MRVTAITLVTFNWYNAWRLYRMIEATCSLIPATLCPTLCLLPRSASEYRQSIASALHAAEEMADGFTNTADVVMSESETAAAQFDSQIRDYRTTVTKMKNAVYKDALPTLDHDIKGLQEQVLGLERVDELVEKVGEGRLELLHYSEKVMSCGGGCYLKCLTHHLQLEVRSPNQYDANVY